MGKVFVSYSRQDREVADGLAAKLNNAGLDVWIDREAIRAGRHWRTEIVETLDTCDALILLISPYSAKSDNVLKEVTLAEGASRKIFPVLVAETEMLPDMRYLLAGVQIMDMTQGDVEAVYLQLEKNLLENKAILDAQSAKQIDGAPLKTEIVIQGVDIKNFNDAQQKKLIAFLAEMTGTEQKKMTVASVTAGSVHVFIDMPRATAFDLKSLALNNDPRFKQMNIVAVGVAGTALVTLAVPFWIALLAFLTAPAGIAATSVVAVTTLVVMVSQGVLFSSKGAGLENTPMAAVTEITATETNLPITEESREESEVTQTLPAVVVVDTATNTLVVTASPTAANTVATSPTVTNTMVVTPIPTVANTVMTSPTATLLPALTNTPLSPTLAPTATTAETESGGRISGIVWFDTDKDKYFQAYDSVVAGVVVNLRVQACGGAVFATTTTDLNGEFEFLNLSSQKYCLEMDYGTLPAVAGEKWNTTEPETKAGLSPKTIVRLGEDEEIELDFRMFRYKE